MDQENTKKGRRAYGSCGKPAQYVEQIALNKAGIACLDGRVGRAERDIRERYSKEEVDRMLAGKADRCALEKHAVDACAHRSRCRPGICSEPGICGCDCYTKEELDRLLAGKANAGTPEMLQLPVVNDTGHSLALIWKNPFNVVTASMYFSLTEPLVTSGLLAVLPEGFRPSVSQQYPCTTYPPLGSSVISILTDGSIRGAVDPLPGVFNYYLNVDFVAR